MLRFSKVSKGFLIAIVAVVLIFMYAPLSVLILNAFNERQISAWPIQEFSFKWWVVAFESEDIRAALLNSAIVAFGAMTIAMILGSSVNMSFLAKAQSTY
jgi:putative spermidine/putrescine transport system permease protein